MGRYVHSLHGSIWTAFYDEEFVEDYISDIVDKPTLTSAIKQANYWLYNRASANWNYGHNNAVEKALKEDYLAKYEHRRQAFMRHVLSTIAYRYPDMVKELCYYEG
jgi:response regulator RpfG family c-di-GMP phosphodiesterase